MSSGLNSRPSARLTTPAMGVLIGLLGLIPFALENLFLAHLGAQVALLLLYVLSWDLFCWPARQVNFGHAFLIGIAAYTSGLVDTRLGLNPWLAMACGTALAALSASLLGLATLRLRGPYFAMVTMAFQLMLFRFLFLFSELFGGGEGLIGIRPLLGDPHVAALATSLICVVAFAFCVAFRRSTACLFLRASGADENLARASGVRVGRYRTAAFGLSGALAGIGGALQAHTFGQVTSEVAGDWISALVVLLGILGAPFGVAGVAGVTVAYFGLKQLLLPLGGYDAPVLAGLLLASTLWRARQGSNRAALTRGRAS